jgi:sterol desaturase/sphingolipid hydroxylase (fatty acid hydroxylase superfamily)
VNTLLSRQVVTDLLVSGGAIVPLLLAVATWELILPEHKGAAPFARRWTSNFALFAMSVVLTALFAPSLAFATNVVLERSPLRWQPGALGFWLHLAFACLLLDLLTYGVHRLMHSVPWLWRLHALHHSDISLDVSTTVRHHPVEAIFTAVVVGIGGAALGCSAIEVAVYGVLENVVQLLGHADIRLPGFVERAVRTVFVTPKFHRIHHSSRKFETDSNYGQVFAFWDRVLATHGGYANDERGEVEFGLTQLRDAHAQRLDQTLLLPIQLKVPE